MSAFRLTHAAQADIVGILAPWHEQFGAGVHERYESLIATAIRAAAAPGAEFGQTARTELGAGVLS